MMAIPSINVWNRLDVATRQVAGVEWGLGAARSSGQCGRDVDLDQMAIGEQARDRDQRHGRQGRPARRSAAFIDPATICSSFGSSQSTTYMVVLATSAKVAPASSRAGGNVHQRLLGLGREVALAHQSPFFVLGDLPGQEHHRARWATDT